MAKTIFTNAHCREILERAIASPQGIRATFPTPRKAYKARFDCYSVRAQERRESMRIYPPEAPQYGKSPWDELTLEVEGCDLIVYKPTLTGLGISVKEF